MCLSAHKATKYLSPHRVIRATRKLLHGKVPSPRSRGNTTIVLTMGRPNFAERRFIADCKKAGMYFPIRDVQLKYPPKRGRA